MSVKFTINKHLIYQQNDAENAMLKEFEDGQYTLQNPLIKPNLYLVNPLSAVICFNTPTTVAITVTVKGKTPQGNISHTFPAAQKHILPILGLYANYNNQVEITSFRGEKSIIEIPIDDIFNGKQCCYSMDTTPEYLEDNIILVSPSGDDLAFGYDYAGDVRLFFNVSFCFDFKRLQNGNLLVGTDRTLKIPYYMTGLYEMSICGKIYKEFLAPGGYHHDQWEMEDGNLLCVSSDFNCNTFEDVCVLLDRNTGEVLKSWDYKKALQKAFYDINDDVSNWFHTKEIAPSGSWSDEDWFHNNAIFYEKQTHSLTISGRHMDSIINLDYETGELNWIITDPTDWPEELLPRMKKYFFTPIGCNFEWMYEQHGCMVAHNGDIICFDNHHYGAKRRDTQHQRLAKNSFSRAVRYKINTTDMTIEQTWEYGRSRGYAFFSPYIGNIEYYKDGHYLIHSGGICYDKNGLPTDAIGSFIQDDGGDLHSVTLEVYNNKKMLELHVPGNFYRAEKLQLYTDGINLELGLGQQLGSLAVTQEIDIDIPAESTGEIVPEIYIPRITEDIDLFTFFATFNKGQVVILVAENKNECHKYYIKTTRIPYLSIFCGVFQERGKRETRNSICKIGLNGTYDIRIVIDGQKFETGVQITC